MIDFHLVSTELKNPYQPVACHVVRRLRSELRDDLVLVEIDPAQPSHIYDTAQDIHYFILAPRHDGTSLFPVSEWPLPVYICLPKQSVDSVKELISSHQLSITDWGEVRKAL